VQPGLDVGLVDDADIESERRCQLAQDRAVGDVSPFDPVGPIQRVRQRRPMGLRAGGQQAHGLDAPPGVRVGHRQRDPVQGGESLHVRQVEARFGRVHLRPGVLTRPHGPEKPTEEHRPPAERRPRPRRQRLDAG
jgi:hypothetical protein